MFCFRAPGSCTAKERATNFRARSGGKKLARMCFSFPYTHPGLGLREEEEEEGPFEIKDPGERMPLEAKRFVGGNF